MKIIEWYLIAIHYLILSMQYEKIKHAKQYKLFTIKWTKVMVELIELLFELLNVFI